MLPFILGSDDPEELDYVVAPAEPQTVCPLCGGPLEVTALIHGGATFIVGFNNEVDFNSPDFFVGHVEYGEVKCQVCRHQPNIQIHPASYTIGITTKKPSDNSNDLPSH